MGLEKGLIGLHQHINNGVADADDIEAFGRGRGAGHRGKNDRSRRETDCRG